MNRSSQIDKQKNINSIVSLVIFSLFILGIIGSGNLSVHEFLETGTCPKLGPIPACYIILTCLIIPFILHLFDKGKTIYFVFISFALILASYASVGQFLEILQCPKTDNGFPMCYISFAIFLGLLVLKIFQLKLTISK